MAISLQDAALLVCSKSNWTVSNLKLQKMLYIIQMLYFGSKDSKLIDCEFQAWDYGPVIPELYEQLKRFGADNVSRDIFYMPDDIDKIAEKPEGKFIILWLDKLLSKEAWELVRITHRSHTAWNKNYSPRSRKHIPVADMKAEYEHLLQHQQ